MSYHLDLDGIGKYRFGHTAVTCRPNGDYESILVRIGNISNRSLRIYAGNWKSGLLTFIAISC